NLNMDINRVGMETIDKLSGKSIENGSGYISGKLAVQGPAASPEYNGFIKFNDASLDLAQFHSKFYLTKDKIEFDNEGIVLNNFSIEDQNHHNLTIDGSIATENLTNPGFDLNVSADNFQLMKDRKSTRLNSSHVSISYAVFCLK